MKTVKEQIVNGLTWFKNKIDTIFVKSANVVNNCASTSTSYPLSAAQGKSLQDQITSLNSNLSNKSDKGHAHDERYYTETEINTLLNTRVPNMYRNTRVQAQTIDIDIKGIQHSQCWGFIILCHSWIAGDNGASMYWVTGIAGQANTSYWDVQALYKSGHGPAVTIVNGGTIRVTFNDSNGGGYGIIPMIY